MCNEFFFFFLSNIIILILKKLENFVLKIKINSKIFYFVDILSGVKEIFLPDCFQIFFLLNVEFRGIFEPHKSPIQRNESSYR